LKNALRLRSGFIVATKKLLLELSKFSKNYG